MSKTDIDIGDKVRVCTVRSLRGWREDARVYVITEIIDGGFVSVSSSQEGTTARVVHMSLCKKLT